VSKSNTRSFITRLFVFVVSLALVGADLFVSSAQNANSSTTSQNDNMSMQNTNMSGVSTRPGRRRRRRGRRRSSGMGMSNANAACGPENTNMAGGMQENANTGEATSTPTMGGGRRRRRGRRRGNMAIPAGQTSTDLQNAEQERTIGKQDDFTGMSYTGTINYPEGNLSGPAKLEFMADNQFSLTPEGGQAMTGRYTAVTTRGYTGVTMMLGTASSSTTPATIISVRLKKVGSGVQIMNVPGERREFSFTSTGTGGGGGRRRRGSRRGTRVAIKPPTVASGNAK
jgi:hypothetical protein